MEWLALTLGVCVIGAVLPVVNAELYLVALVTQQPQLPWWLVALAAAVGQMLGKLIFYYAGRGAWWLPARWRRCADPGRWQRWPAWQARFQRTCRDRPIWTAGVLLVAATVGLPPMAVTSFVAGVTRLPPAAYMVISLVGRFVRFSVVVAASGLLGTWWF